MNIMDETKHETMDFDPTNSLKRCNSTPIINLPGGSKAPVSPNALIPSNVVNSASSAVTITSTTSRSRDASPTPTFNIFAPRARRYSTGFSPLATNPGPLPRLTPRVSQLRQEECADVNSREVNHEREIHTALQISQSWEDLTLDAENWSFKSDNCTDLTNPLHVALPTGIISCSSPSPTSSRSGWRIPPYGLSPSPTRRTFQTRRSMSPIAMRPSTLGPVKRKFELDDNYSNNYSPPPFKKIFTDSSRGHSPCRSPLLGSCPSPDSTEGRTTPKFYVSKLACSLSSQSSSLSAAPSPNSSGTESPMDIIPNLCSKVIVHSHCGGSGSDLDGSDIDFDSDSQNKPASAVRPKANSDACDKLTKLYLARVSTDSNETDCSIDFKSQLNSDLLNTNLMAHAANLLDNKSESSMDCDTMKQLPNTFSMVQQLVSSTDDIRRQMNESAAVAIDNTKAAAFIGKCGANNVCVSVADIVDTKVAMVEAAAAAKSSST